MTIGNLTRHLIARRRRQDRKTGLTRRPLTRHLPVTGRLYIGQGSVTDTDRRVKYVDRKEPLYPYTWGELGREWLREKYQQLGVVERRRPLLGITRNADIPPALYFEPGDTPGDWVYADIAACYGTLLGRWPLETRYLHALALKGGQHLYQPGGPMLPVADLIACKPLRLAVWGTIRGNALQWRSTKGDWRLSHGVTRLTQPGVSGLVLVAVHEIAWRAVHELGARMWLTDAAILPLARLWEFVAVLQGWGLRARIKGVGACKLTGLGAYRVGERKSETFGRVTPAVNRLLEPLPWRSV